MCSSDINLVNWEEIQTHLLVWPVIQPHTTSLRGFTGNIFAGLFEFWQGLLSPGTYQITVQHRGGASVRHNTNVDYLTRAMDIIYCY